MRPPFNHLTRPLMLTLAMLALLTAGCTGEAEPSASAEEPIPAEAMTNRIDVPSNVRQNLGISFATVERRPVQRTVRLPGRFEFRPNAKHEHRAMLSGRIELLVDQYEHVEPGQPLFRIDSPRWQEVRHEVVEAEGEIALAQAQLAVAEAAEAENRGELEFLDQRLKRLSEAQVRRIELDAQHAELTNRQPRLQAEVQAKEVELDEAHEHYSSILKVAASVTNLPVATLLQSVEMHEDEHGHERVRWRNMKTLEIRARSRGIVQTLAVSPGGWAETGELVLTIVNPQNIRFRADAPQSDLAQLHEGQRIQLVPPEGGSISMQDALPGTLSLGIEGHPGERTMPVYGLPTDSTAWARPGVTAYMEVFIDGEEHPQLAIPESSLVRQGLETIFYRRDPNNADQVYPVQADLGVSDGRWVVVRSGVTDGDQVVLDGAYALKMAGGQQQAPPGHHYHADGTLHKNH
ncbi:MAG: HlyD family efflux transporter periplasmic adaptor subunit [Phycisphaeraceae bacterium]